jgi:hypothetical protein
MSGNQGKGQNPGAEAAFWERYAKALERAGVPEKRRRWHQRDCERFISWLQPARLKQAQGPQIIEYLLYLEGTGLESWQLKQSSEALRTGSQHSISLKTLEVISGRPVAFAGLRAALAASGSALIEQSKRSA